MATTEVVVPDIGDFEDVPVIEILVSPGDTVSAEDPLVTLESDKATMDVPAPLGGVVKEITVRVGDAVSQGVTVLLLDTQGAGNGAPDTADDAGGQMHAQPSRDDADSAGAGASPRNIAPSNGAGGATLEVKVPDIGEYDSVPVIEILVGVGDAVSVEDPLLTLESDKATMDVPSPQSGVVKEIKVSLGDSVSEGTAIVVLTTEALAATQAAPAPPAGESAAAAAPEPAPAPGVASMHPGASAPDPRAPQRLASPTQTLQLSAPDERVRSHATPAIRKFARSLGVGLAAVKGTGRKGRVLREDVEAHVKQQLSGRAGSPTDGAPSAEGAGIPPIPAVDHSKYGEVETQPLSRIKRISGPFLQRAWLNVPHVTNHDEADITELEAFRRALKDDPATKDTRVTPLAFFMKALTHSLRAFPTFNASLTPDGKDLVVKKYFHIGVAVDTPNGLVVPVFRNVDTKGVVELATELGEISGRAREGKLKPDEMQGGCISISSLGGIGGTAFTPIVNAPEVAILGISRSRMTPVWNGSEFVPRLMLPLDLSYDHRVIDGAQAARFLSHYCGLLADVRKLLL